MKKTIAVVICLLLLTMSFFGCTEVPSADANLDPSPSIGQEADPTPDSGENGETNDDVPSGGAISSTTDKSNEVYVLVQNYDSWTNERRLVFESVKIVDADDRYLTSIEFSAKNEKLCGEIKDYLSKNNILGVDLSTSAIKSKNWLIYAYFSESERIDFEKYLKNKYPEGYNNRYDNNFFAVKYGKDCLSVEYHYLSERNSSYRVSTGYNRYYLDSYLYNFVERGDRNDEIKLYNFYDDNGNLTRKENRLTGVKTWYTYDESGNLWYSEDSNGHVWYYDKTEQVANGTIERVRDEDGNILFQIVSVDDDRPRYFDENGNSMFMTDDMYIYYISSTKYSRFELSDNKIVYFESKDKPINEPIREEYDILFDGYGALYLSKTTYLDTGVTVTYTYADNGELLSKTVSDPSGDILS